MRILATLALLVGLSACTDMPTAQPCPNPQACQLATLMAADFAPAIGTDFGGGVLLRDVQAAGSLVVMDIEVPIPGGPMEPVQKTAIHQVVSRDFVAGFCDDMEVDLFQFGNAFQMRTFGNDGVVLGASTIRSCGA